VAAFDPFAESVDYDTSEASEESMYKGGGAQVGKEGFYHVMVTHVEYVEAVEKTDETKASLPHVDVTLKVLAGTEESEVDKQIYHSIYMATWVDKEKKDEMKALEGRQLTSVLAFFYAFGTIGAQILGQKSVHLSAGMYERLEDQNAVVKVGCEKNTEGKVNPKTGEVYPDRYKVRWNNDAWPVTHEKVKLAECPLNPDYTNFAIPQKPPEVAAETMDSL